MTSARLIEVIVVNTPQGAGTVDDPSRMVTTLWTKDGQMICKVDPFIDDQAEEFRLC